MGPEHVRRQKELGLEDTAVDVRLGREVDDFVDVIRRKQLLNRLTVANIDLLEDVERIGLERLQILEVSRVCQTVDVKNAGRWMFFPIMSYEI